MPTYKRRRTTTTPNRYVRKRRKFLRAKRRLYRKRIPIGMPAKRLVKLKYCDTISLDPTSAGNPDFHYFSCNGMFDPDITGAGHQPLYFDQYMVNYDHYQVIGSAIKITNLPFTSESRTPALWGCIIDDHTTFSYPSAEEIVESNQGKNFRMASAGVESSLNTGGKHPVMYKKFSAKKMLGDLSDKHEGSATSNPTDQMFYGIWAASPGGGADPSALRFMVEISYIAILKEPKYVPQS